MGQGKNIGATEAAWDQDHRDESQQTKPILLSFIEKVLKEIAQKLKSRYVDVGTAHKGRDRRKRSPKAGAARDDRKPG